MKKLNLKTKYPQNYIIEKPVFGALILFVFIFVFVLLFQPVNTHKSRWFNFEVTMFLYSFIASFSAWVAIVLLKRIRFFANKKDWSILKEVISVYLILQAMGIAAFLFAFIIEDYAENSRWNIITFIDSCKYPFLIGIFPFAFFTAMNYKFWFKNGESIESKNINNKEDDILININSSLKKETLSFRANEFLFATSDGNYVIFYLLQNNEIKKISIRNSISNIENQFTDFPDFFRCHRAFIVNINKVHSKKGNALGYQLSIANCSDKVPVSRQNIKAFDTLFAKSTQ